MRSFFDGDLDSDQKYKLGNYGEIALHARNQFELKLAYKLNPDEDEANFKLETYFFIPHSFRIGPENYSKEKFYEDMQVYVRYNPILISLPAIINPENNLSPLSRAMKILNDISGGDISQYSIKQIIHELKMIAVIASSYVEKYVESIRSLTQVRSRTHQNVIDAQKQVQILLDQVQAFNFSFRKKRDQFFSPSTSIEIKETFDFVMEYISLIFQKELIKVLQYLTQARPRGGEFNELIDKTKNILKKEREFRSACGFNSVLNQGEENEPFAYRFSILKKYVSNVLYLTARPEVRPKAVREIIYAGAAGIAMLAAVLLTYISQLFFAEYTLPFITAVVIGYMIKDRIKDWIKVLFGQEGTFGKKFDYKSTIKDVEGNKIGSSKEKFAFISALPPEIMNLRNRSHMSKIEAEGKPENVIKYVKSVKLFPKIIRDVHARVLDTSDIIRFDISNFLTKIENPYSYYQWFDPKSEEVEFVKAARVYHLNLIIKFSYETNGNETTYINRIRLVVDKKGIKRIEIPFK